jgi:Sigma-70, region 4
VADSVGLALLVVLDTLTPTERLAFVLHDMFDLPFDEIAPIVGRSPTAARKLASRARHRVQAGATVARRRSHPPEGGRPLRLCGCVPPLGFAFTGDKVAAIDVIADPPRLRQLDLAVLQD